MTSNLSSSAPRGSHSRNHSHSISAGSINPTHRVTRRKSVSVNQPNPLAVAAAVREIGDSSFMIPVPMSSARRNTMSRSGGSKFAGLSTPPASLPGNRMSSFASSNRKTERDESAIEDEQDAEGVDSFKQQRARRASEGQKDNGKKGDLRCDKCGKGYKHSSCLTKHLFVSLPFVLSFLLPRLEIRD